MLNRRNLFKGGLATLICAPAIVRAASLMTISPISEFAVPATARAAAWKTVLTPDMIAREAVKILEQNLLKEMTSDFYWPDTPQQIRIGSREKPPFLYEPLDVDFTI